MAEEQKIRVLLKPVSLAKKIESVTDGLNYISETDSDIFPFQGTKADAVTKEILLDQIGNTLDTPVEERSFDEVFDRLTKNQDWFGDEEKKVAARYLTLRRLLERNLIDLKVFKVGRIRINIYFVGLDDEENLSGFRVEAVET